MSWDDAWPELLDELGRSIDREGRVIARRLFCPRCGGVGGAHGLVHTRYDNGAGGNRPCPESESEH